MLSDVRETHSPASNEIPVPNSSMQDITKELYEKLLKEKDEIIKLLKGKK